MAGPACFGIKERRSLLVMLRVGWTRLDGSHPVWIERGIWTAGSLADRV